MEYYYIGGCPVLLEDCNKKTTSNRICKFKKVENELKSYTKKKADLKYLHFCYFPNFSTLTYRMAATKRDLQERTRNWKTHKGKHEIDSRPKILPQFI